MSQRNSRKRDRLSELSDDILAQILTKLETLDAVRTCILSKRWVHLWTHITALQFHAFHYCGRCNGDYRNNIHVCRFINFHCPRCIRVHHFQKFVSMVLHRLAAPSIESFVLKLDSGILDESAFTTWSLVLVNKRVKNLSIFYHPGYYYGGAISSPNIFICHSLVHLSLNIESAVRVPKFVHLPNLQTLELSDCQFMSDQEFGNSDEHIILSFPVLKKLKSYRTLWHVKSVSFEVPFLEMVEMTETQSSFHTCLVNYNVISKPSPYVNASVSITFYDECDSEEQRMQWDLRVCVLLKQLNINHVKHLEISSTKVCSFVEESFADLPTFNMLCHLKLSRVSGRMLIELLLKSPYLTSLTIEMEDYLLESDVEISKPDHAEKLLECGIVPDCISNTLKVLKVQNFVGHEDEFSLVKYMMDNAEHLELLSISPSWVLQRRSEKEMEKVMEKLFSMKRGLNLTTLDLSHFERCSNK